MARLYFSTHTPNTLALNTQLPFKLYIFICTTNTLLHSFVTTFASTTPITPKNTENCLPSDDPNITNLMVSHYDCKNNII